MGLKLTKEEHALQRALALSLDSANTASSLEEAAIAKVAKGNTKKRQKKQKKAAAAKQEAAAAKDSNDALVLVNSADASEFRKNKN